MSEQPDKVVLIRKRNPFAIDLGYLVRPLVRMQIPMTRPPEGMRIWERRDGDTRMQIVTSSALPHGSDMLTLYGLCTKGRELYKKYKRDWDGIVYFSSTAEMLDYFGDPRTKYYYNLRMKSLLRIWDAQLRVITVTDRKGKAEKRELGKADFIDEMTAWFQLEDRQLGMPFENVIQFSGSMVDWIRQAPQFDDAHVQHLRKSIGALQLYLFLRDRCAQRDLLEKPYSLIPIHGQNSLESQLGWVRVPRKVDVRQQLKGWLKAIRDPRVWPDCPAKIVEGNDGYWRLKVSYVKPLYPQQQPLQFPE